MMKKKQNYGSYKRCEKFDNYAIYLFIIYLNFIDLIKIISRIKLKLSLGGIKMSKKYTYNLLNFWFENEDIWFNCSQEDDIQITKRYKTLFESVVIYNYELENSEDLLYNIILYDQIARHIYRGNQEMISKYHTIALNFSRHLIKSNLIEELEPKEKCFALMPFRHQFIEKDVSFALSKIREYRKDNMDNPYYRRFYYATVRSLAKIRDETLAKSIPYSLNYGIIGMNFEWEMKQFPYDILDEKCLFSGPGWTGIQKIPNKYKQFIKDFRNTIPKLKEDEKLILSISGGVDSMVCSYILKSLGINFMCFMINYGNRESSKNSSESHMVYEWCVMLGIPLYIRNITEIKRTQDIDRNFYEEVTRDIRFRMYKLLGNSVVLGHNKDDTVENIFANLSKSRNYNNLRGMERESDINDVKIYRPMLGIEKSEIFKFADEMNIPYLYDSTPKWSERGKMRDILVPSINDFNSCIIPGLCDLSEYVTEMYNDLEKLVKDTIDIKFEMEYDQSGNIQSKYVVIKKTGCIGFMFWNIIIMKICKLYNKPYVTKKAMKIFLKSLKSGQNSKFVLNKKMNGVIKPNHIIIYV